jgi:hypothetical protein
MHGGIALHLMDHSGGIYPNAPACFKQTKSFAHLFDQDTQRLQTVARWLGVRKVVVSKQNTYQQHVDLCGRPLERALLGAAEDAPLSARQILVDYALGPGELVSTSDDVLDIIRDGLELAELDGLQAPPWVDECGCDRNDLAPCGNPMACVACEYGIIDVERFGSMDHDGGNDGEEAT